MARMERAEFERLVEEVRNSASIKQVAEHAGVEWDARKSVPRRGDFWACCPFHHEATPSFHVLEGRGFFKCFGCEQAGDVIKFLSLIRGCSYMAALRELAERGGVAVIEEDEAWRKRKAAREAEAKKKAKREEREADSFHRSALTAWANAKPPGALLRAYLETRGVRVDLMLEALGGWPPSIRFAPDLPYYDRHEGRLIEVWSGPAMVCAIGREETPLGVHRTWIGEHGRAWVGGRKLEKKWIGRPGAMFGQPVAFSPPAARMIVGEGIETTLAVWSRLLAGDGPRWAAEASIARGALAGSGLRVEHGRRGGAKPPPSPYPDMSSRAWAPPDEVEELVILAEGSSRDPRAAEAITHRAVRRHRRRRDGSARSCSFRLPGGRWDADIDFADVAAAEMARGGEARRGRK